jgi:hypothetical protein
MFSTLHYAGLFSARNAQTLLGLKKQSFSMSHCAAGDLGAL